MTRIFCVYENENCKIQELVGIKTLLSILYPLDDKDWEELASLRPLQISNIRNLQIGREENLGHESEVDEKPKAGIRHYGVWLPEGLIEGNAYTKEHDTGIVYTLAGLFQERDFDFSDNDMNKILNLRRLETLEMAGMVITRLL